MNTEEANALLFKYSIIAKMFYIFVQGNIPHKNTIFLIIL